MKDKPLVTAVITTYKRPVEMVRRALESVVFQGYENIEVIVVNDYPEDPDLVKAIGDMLKEYEEKRPVHYIVAEKNGGACKARNLALSAAGGKYIAFLDDDDHWRKNKIELQVSKIEKCPDAAAAYCNAINIRENQNKKELRFKDKQPEGDIFYRLICSNVIGSCSMPLIRRELLREIGGFREDMPALQDWEMYLRLLKNHTAVYLSDPLVVYHIYEGERISLHPERRTDAFEKIYAEFREDIEKNKKCASAFYLMGTYFYSMAGDMVHAAKYYIKGVANDPTNVKRNLKDFGRMAFRKFAKKKIA